MSQGAAAVDVELDEGGDYRCLLRDVPEPESAAFAEALDEVASPRQVVPRWVLTDPGLSARRRPPGGGLAADGVGGRPSPWPSGATSRAADCADAWAHWLGGGEPVATGSSEETGVPAAQQHPAPLVRTDRPTMRG